MSAADCPRRFIMLAAGGVRVRWACGAETVNPRETGVDLLVLAEKAEYDHHHHVLHLPRRRG